MSVRRLADSAVQPAAFAFTEANAAWAEKAIAKYPEGRQHSAVIPLLMRAQEQEGWVTRPAIECVAAMLDMPLIRVLEVATFYTQFMLAPVGKRAHVQVCGTTPCLLRGAGEIIERCKARIHPEPLHTNEDGSLSWEEVECQGACVNAPMMMIFKDTYEDLTPERFDEIIDAFAAGRGDTIEPGTQIDRLTSAPASGLTTLTDESVFTKPAVKDNGRVRGEDSDKQVPPSKAGKPDTHAAETDPTISTPSGAKANQARETTKSVEAPGYDEAAADHTADESDGKTRRSHSRAASTGRKPTVEIAGAESAKPAARKASASKGRRALTPASEAKGRAPGDSSSGMKRPGSIDKPARPDDLKLISGVGPKIEGVLNDLGVYTYEQMAAWTPQERAWVDDHLSFRGRIERDNWVGQADALARGGVEEYVRVFGRKPR